MLHDWDEALDYLYHFANWETRPPGTPLTFELDRARRVLARLGDPQDAWPAVHIAGTNGKGSTAALIASVLRASGCRTGLYTSPHLHTVRERVQVDGVPIGRAEVIEWLGRHRGILDAEAGLTTFEALTVMAFSTFAARKVDLAVVEVGLGGRLDTTNVVRPVVSVITPIGLDHTRVLGDTVGQIASDKAGILRPGVPAVLAPQQAEAESVLQSRVSDLSLRCARVGHHAVVRRARQLSSGQRLVVDCPGWSDRHTFRIGLLGAHQRVNAVTALCVAHFLGEAGWPIDRRAIADGMAAATWPGRFELLRRRPPVVVDGAHNPAAAEALCTTMDERLPGLGRVLLLGFSLDKDVDAVLERLLPGARRVVATRADHPRAMEADDVARAVRRHLPVGSSTRVQVANAPAAALDLALAAAGSTDAVVATGSLFVVADVRMAWAVRGGMPMPPNDLAPTDLDESQP